MELFQSIMNFARSEHSEMIDEAYEYYWEEDDPEDFMGGTALSLGFINFEDWFVCDFQPKEGKPIIDLYREASEGLSDEENTALNALQESYLSIYEVISKDDTVALKDLLLDEEFSVQNEALESLNVGDIFASRFLNLDGKRMMCRCVYPFSSGAKDVVLENFNIAAKRYLKNEPEGTVRDFIKKYSYTFNIIWLDNIFKSRRRN